MISTQIPFVKYKTPHEPVKLFVAVVATISRKSHTCAQSNILSKKTEQISHAIRSYRNLIHPGRLIRLEESVDEDGAKVAQALVKIVIKEVSARKKENYGYTAEQIVSKIERDSSVKLAPQTN